MKLTISIVNWNVSGYLEKCLESIFKFSEGIGLEVIVVDNASKDNSVLMLREKFPRVRLIENTENVGYGSAHNQAIAFARGEHVLFLNPDTEMLAETLPCVLRFMDTYPKAAAILCREIGDPAYTNETVLVMSKLKRVLWFLSQRIHAAWPNSWTSHYIVDCIANAHQDAMMKYVFGGKKLISENGFIFSRQEYLEGGFLLARHQAIRDAGGFDPKFFLCDEGSDLTSRFKKKGWELYYLVNVRVVHYGAKCSEVASDAEIERMELDWGKNRMKNEE